MHVIRILAEHAASTHADALQPRARTAAVRCVFDLVGAAAAGLSTSAAAATRTVARKLYGHGSAPVWFAGAASSAIGAAFCNSAASSALDLDDGHRMARGHPGASVIPAAIATAAEVGASAADLLAAIALGYEVCVRIGAARSVNARSGVWCGYGAAAACAWLRRLPSERLAHALAIAGMTAPQLLSTTGGPRYPAPIGSDVKEGIPWSTVTAMTAVDLAAAGMTGPVDILDHAPHHDRARLLDGLGTGTPAICQIYFKPYASCRHVHGPVDAVAALMARHAVAPDAIRSIDVFVYEGALAISNRSRPRSMVEAQFSIPYCVGLVVRRGVASLLPMEEADLHRPEVLAIADKVRLHRDAALDARFPAESVCRVVLTTATDRCESPVTAPRGEAGAPFSDTELREKFMTATRATLSQARQRAVVAAVDALSAGNLGPLLQVLAEAPA